MYPVFDTIMGSGILVLGILSIIILVLYFVSPKYAIILWIQNNILIVGFVIALGGVMGSLIYSEIIGFEPCRLCWYQRVALFPIALLSGIAIIKKHSWITLYGLVLSIIGGIIAIYHIILEKNIFGDAVNLPCAADAVSCTVQYVYVFDGLITIPSMSFVVFFALFTVFFIGSKK
ncbi:MAG: disulfide bond formation protein B [Candidatus Pacebacteria bacterium]|nr:disulfide bond formation protein B [Candidatus Paceibacterota bacterium]